MPSYDRIDANSKMNRNTLMLGIVCVAFLLSSASAINVDINPKDGEHINVHERFCEEGSHSPEIEYTNKGDKDIRCFFKVSEGPFTSWRAIHTWCLVPTAKRDATAYFNLPSDEKDTVIVYFTCFDFDEGVCSSADEYDQAESLSKSKKSIKIYYEVDCSGDITDYTCDEGFTGDYYCRGEDLLMGEYMYEDCTTEWIEVRICEYGCSRDSCDPPPSCTYFEQSSCVGSQKQVYIRDTDCTERTLVEQCEYGCEDGECKSPPESEQTPEPEEVEDGSKKMESYLNSPEHVETFDEIKNVAEELWEEYNQPKYSCPKLFLGAVVTGGLGLLNIPEIVACVDYIANNF